MGQIKIQDLNSRGRDRRLKLWVALKHANTTIQRMEETGGGGFMLTAEDRQMEHLIRQENKNILHSYGFKTFTPLDISAKRTIFIKYIDIHIAKSSKEDITRSIEENHPDIEVEDVIHIPGALKVLKVRLATIAQASILKQKGIEILNQKIEPQHIEEEVYIRLTPCYVCFQYSHKTSDCPNPDLRICSECSSIGHLYKDCTDLPKKCINCQGPHRTLAARCQTRKDLIKKRSKEIRDNKRQTKRQQDQPKQDRTTTSGALPNNATAVMQSALVYACWAEITTPGSFQTTINDIYDMNKIPRVKLPTPQNLHELISVAQRARSPTPPTKPQNPSVNQQRRKRRQRKIKTSTPTNQGEINENITESDTSLEDLRELNSFDMEWDSFDEEDNNQVESLLTSQMPSENLYQITSNLEPLMEEIKSSSENINKISKHNIKRLARQGGITDIRLQEETKPPKPKSEKRTMKDWLQDVYVENKTHVRSATVRRLARQGGRKYITDTMKIEDQHQINNRRWTMKQCLQELHEKNNQEIPRPDWINLEQLTQTSTKILSFKRTPTTKDSKERSLVPKHYGVHLVGHRELRPSNEATNSELYELFDAGQLSLVIDEETNLTEQDIIDSMNNEAFDLTAQKIRFFHPIQYFKMKHGNHAFTWGTVRYPPHLWN